MKKADVLIIGGSAAGPTAGISCRRRYPGKNVVLVRKEEKVLVPCGIPYIIGTVGSPDKNLIPDSLLDKNSIELVKDEAVAIDRNQKLVSLASGHGISYDKLILATGSLPFQLPIPGLDKENVFVVKKDVAYLQNMIDVMGQVKDIVIIGGGFIGVEFADECRKRRNCKDCNVTIVEILPSCLQLALDEEFCQEAEGILRESKINVLTNKKVEAIIGNHKVSGVRLSDGEELKADLVIIGVGAVPNVELAERAGLKIGLTKAISVDRHMRTINDNNIFACGDCAEKTSFFSGRLSRLMLASIATAEARISGANLYGTCYSNPGAIGVFCTKVGERALGCAGL
ncbi:MAG: FAD/NAD(P)-binding oxidoreductase, partial [Dehalococcoidales bacterium]|nr:FAD/NAD(P)-binding oxidoreductase [Dehalococcoidales bacterium]